MCLPKHPQMIKLSVWVAGFLLAISCTPLYAGKSAAEFPKYIINIEYKDSTLFINLSFKAKKAETDQNNFFLFNPCIFLNEALLDETPLTYRRSNDTLYYESPGLNETTLFMRYEIPCSAKGYRNIVSACGDSIFTYPALFDTSQLFCERFHKWYPVLYDNFSNYEVNITVPNTHKVFAYYTETDCLEADGKITFSYHCFDEDFPFFITPTSIFQQHTVIRHNNTNYEFCFLPRPRRLVAVTDNKPVFISDKKQIDSLLNASIYRSIAAVEWYTANLWKQEIKTLRFIETGILGLAAGLGSFILMDRMLMNMEAIDNYALSHEISHLWLGIHTEYLAKGKFFMGESIPEYVNLLYYESWAGTEAFNKAINDKVQLKLFEVPFYTVTFEQVINQRKGNPQADEIIYHKGVAFVHEFRKMIGHEKLLKIIRDTYSVPAHFVTLTDFENKIKANDCWNAYLKLYEMNL